jgi:hypothetical protein
MTALTGHRVKGHCLRYDRITAHSALNAAPMWPTMGRQAQPSGVVGTILNDVVCVCVSHPKRPEPIWENLRQLRQSGVFSPEARWIVITELIQVVAVKAVVAQRFISLWPSASPSSPVGPLPSKSPRQVRNC